MLVGSAPPEEILTLSLAYRNCVLTQYESWLLVAPRVNDSTR